MSAIATFRTALNALLSQPGPEGRPRHVQVIAVAVFGEGEESALRYVVVDAEGHTHLLGAEGVKITDDSVLPPKYA